jgi:hypothetical protein
VWFECVKSKELRFAILKWICRSSRVLIFNPVKEVGSVSLGLLIKNDNNSRVILLILCTTTSVSLSRLPFKHKKRLATLNSICKDCNLKGTLPLVMPTLPLLKTDCPVPLLAYIRPLRNLNGSGDWSIL